MSLVTSGAAATYAAQVISALVLALLLAGFYRQYQKSYLLHWTFGWASLAIFHALLPAAIAPLRMAAGYTQVAWFCFGAYELVRRRPFRMVVSQRTLFVLAVAGAIGGLFFPAVAIIIRNISAAVAFVACAVSLWRVRMRRTGFGVPVLSAAYVIYGIVQVDPIPYADFLLQSLLAAGMIACLLEDEREAAELASAEIEHLAYHDALTGLPNRPLFIDRLIVAIAQAHRAGAKLAVLFLDLDRFKDINDSLGHSMGDQLLKAVAERVRRCVREGDTVARFGGDEFTLVIPRMDNVEDAAKIAQKIIDTLKIPFVVNDRELFATTSIGISIYPNDGGDAETLVRNADSAMYRAKESGRDNYQLYAPAMNARALERLALENMLRKALSQKELTLHYQPLVDAQTKAITGFEALIRWHHPELGLLSPAHFISVAELSGLIVPIGEWVLRTACKQGRVWQKKLGRDLVMSVNLSARQFSQPDLTDQIRSALRETGFPASCLELEITESNAMQNAQNTIHTLRELKALGVRIAMDDFGTGYSSLNYLKRFPIDTLKLDQSFVSDVTSDPADAAIVSAVISMSHSLELEVVAEGVETAEQLSFLQRQRCDRIQGYFFSAPLTADEVESYVAARAAASA